MLLIIHQIKWTLALDIEHLRVGPGLEQNLNHIKIPLLCRMMQWRIPITIAAIHIHLTLIEE